MPDFSIKPTHKSIKNYYAELEARSDSRCVAQLACRENETLQRQTSLVYNNFLTLSGIPPKALDYRLGTPSALEWIVDQYRVKTDKRSGIVNAPNCTDDPEYIVKLIGKVITVSLETVAVIENLPELSF